MGPILEVEVKQGDAWATQHELRKSQLEKRLPVLGQKSWAMLMPQMCS